MSTKSSAGFTTCILQIGFLQGHFGAADNGKSCATAFLAMILTERPFEPFSLPAMNGCESYEQRPDTSGAAASEELSQYDSGAHLKAENDGRDVERPRFRFAMVCASNQNRSMAAHALLQKSGLLVHSYGTGSQVKLPN